MRSIDPDDYQDVPRAVAVLARNYEAGTSTGSHSHPRTQLLYATSGLMLATTRDGSWAVPAGHALLIPPQLVHDVTMHGQVSMLTAYLSVSAFAAPSQCRVLPISPLLDVLLMALAGEPVLYDENGRGGHLAALVLDEIRRAPATPFVLPLPEEPRLRRLCRELIENPGLRYDLDIWADRIGVSRRTLTRHFRLETGLSFGEWRRRVRMVDTMVRKAHGEGLHRIAPELGYSSVRAFQAMIRRTATERKTDED